MFRRILSIPCYAIAVIESIALVLLFCLNIPTWLFIGFMIFPIAFLAGEEKRALEFMGSMLVVPLEIIDKVWRKIL